MKLNAFFSTNLTNFSFHIIVQKMKQDKLRKYGPIRAFDCGEYKDLNNNSYYFIN